MGVDLFSAGGIQASSKSIIICSPDVFANRPTQLRQPGGIPVREHLTYPYTGNQSAQSLKFFCPHGAIQYVCRKGIGDECQNGALIGERFDDWRRIGASLAQYIDRLQRKRPGLEV